MTTERKIVKTGTLENFEYTMIKIDNEFICVEMYIDKGPEKTEYNIELYSCDEEVKENLLPTKSKNGYRYFISSYYNEFEAYKNYDLLIDDIIEYKYTPRISRYVTADIRNYVKVDLCTEIMITRGTKLKDVKVTVETKKSENEGHVYYTTIDKVTVPSKRPLKGFKMIYLKSYGRDKAIETHNRIVRNILNEEE